MSIPEDFYSYVDKKIPIRVHFYPGPMDKNIIYSTLREVMCSEFKLDADSISPEKLLEDDLDLDSLDLVDLLMGIEDFLDKRIEPDIFKGARIVQDLVDSLLPHWK